MRKLFGSPFLPARLLQLLLACVASAAVAAAVQRLGEDFLRKGKRGEASGAPVSLRAASWCAVAGGVFYGAYGPLVFHDFFLYRDGPVAHVSTLLVALPLVLGPGAAFGLGLLGGAAVLMKQTVLPLALFSLYSLSRKSESPGGRERGRSLLFGLLGLALPLGVLAVRNVSAGVPPLTFDTRQSIGLVWGNGFGADATTNPPPTMKEILEEAGGSTAKTAKLVLAGYREQPLELPKLFLKKFATFFNAFEVPDNANFYFFRDRLKILRMLPVFSCVLGVGLVGLFAALTRGVLRKEEVAAGSSSGFSRRSPRASSCRPPPVTVWGRSGRSHWARASFFSSHSKKFAGAAGAPWPFWPRPRCVLSLVPLLPSTIYDARHRWSDTLVYATLAEGERGPEAAAEEIRRYVEEGGDDRSYDTALRAFRYWVKTGERSQALVEPEGVAPPERRLREFPKTSRDALFSR